MRADWLRERNLPAEDCGKDEQDNGETFGVFLYSFAYARARGVFALVYFALYLVHGFGVVHIT